ncbi:MAG: hypothetical protein LUD02_16230 [Tannerellaceae bacterium]|nr:hypothetical protein [Tannerellaceae bacterium]
MIFRKDIPNPLGSAAVAQSISDAWLGLPMNGKGSGYVKAGETTIIPIDGLRLISRINSPTTHGTLVALSAGEKERLEQETGTSFGDKLAFRLDGHIMINGARSYKFFPKYGVENEYDRWNISSWMETQAYHKTVYKDGQLVLAYGGNRFLPNDTAIYVYENTPPG